MEQVIKTIRSKDGRLVILTRERWAHIIDEHPELTDLLEDVARAVNDPARAMTGRSDDEQWFYLADAGPSKWLKVIVVFDERRVGRIITAFPRRKRP